MDAGEVSDGVSDSAPAAESMDRGAGDPSASPLFVSGPAGWLSDMARTGLGPIGLVITLAGPTTRGAGLSIKKETHSITRSDYEIPH